MGRNETHGRGTGKVAKGLTIMERLAADYYVAHRKKREAYEFAYSTSRMKDKTIERRTSEVFARPHVAAYVEAQLRTVAEHVQINADWVKHRAALIADFNIRRFIRIEPGGMAVYDFSDATDDDWYCIDEYTVEMLPKEPGMPLEVKKIKLKTTPKLRALELVGKMHDVQAFKETIVVIPGDTEHNDLTNTERSSRIATLLDRGRGRRASETNNAGGAKVATAARAADKS